MATQYTAGITQGQAWTAAIANQIGAVSEPYPSTITVSQPGTIACTVNLAQYQRIQKLVIGYAKVTVTGTGTAGNSLGLSLPIAAKYGQVAIGTGYLYDSSAAILYNASLYSGSNTVAWFIGDWAANGVWGTVPNLAIAANDVIYASFLYEAA